MSNVDQEEAARHGPRLVEMLVTAAYVMIIATYVVILVALMMGAGYPPTWTPEHWSAYADILSVIVSALALAGIFYGLVYQRQQLADAKQAFEHAKLAHERELAYRDEQLVPSFIKSTVALSYDWYGVADGDDRPALYQFTIRVRNSGGPAHDVKVYLNGAASHPAVMRPTAFREIGDLPPHSDAPPFSFYREIADEHRSSVDRNAEFPVVFSGWQCGPLIFEYVNRQHQRCRSEFEFVARFSIPPQPANYEMPVTLVNEAVVTNEMPGFESLIQGASERARTDYAARSAGT